MKNKVDIFMTAQQYIVSDDTAEATLRKKSKWPAPSLHCMWSQSVTALMYTRAGEIAGNNQATAANSKLSINMHFSAKL